MAPLTGNVLSNDVVPSALLDYRVTGIRKIGGTTLSNPASVLVGEYGSITVDSLGNYQYTLNNELAEVQKLRKGQTLSEQFYYTSQVLGQTAFTGNSTLTITITGTNDAPVAVADINSATEDAPILNSSVATNDTDNDNTAAELKYTLAAGQSAVDGFTLNSDGSYSFDPANAAYQSLRTGQKKEITINYSVTDLDGARSNSTLTLTITGTNDGPVATADINSAIEDAPPLTGSLASNDTDVDNTAAELKFTLAAGQGAVDGFTLNADGSYTFDPSNAAYQSLRTGEKKEIAINYSVSDLDGAKSDSTLTITITGTNDAPVAVADVNSATEDAPMLVGSVATNDTDSDNTAAELKYTLAAGQNAVSGFVLNADGSYAFSQSPDAYQVLGTGETEEITINYTVADLDGARSDSKLTITITGSNDAPVAAADVNATIEDAEVLKGSVALNDTDVDNTAAELKYALAADQDAVAGFSLNVDGSYTFDPSNAVYQPLRDGEKLVLAINYSVTDPSGASSNSTLTITVTGTNDGPTAEPDALTVFEDRGIFSSSVAENDKDADGGPEQLTFALAPGQLPVTGFTFNTDGTYVVETSAPVYQALRTNEELTQVINYRVTDKDGNFDDSTFTLTTIGTNDAPVFLNKSPDLNLEEDGVLNGSGTLSFKDADRKEIHVVSVTPKNSGYVGTFSAMINDPATEDGEGEIGWTFSADNSSIEIQSLHSDRTLNQVYEIVLSDGEGGITTENVTVNLQGKNDPIMATPVLLEGTEGTGTISIPAIAGVRDIDAGQGRSIVGLGALPAWASISAGSLTIDTNHNSLNSIKAGQVVTSVVGYTASDGETTASSTYTLKVTGVNDQPTAADVMLKANLLGNGGFESTPDFSGWTVSTATGGLTSTTFSNAVVNRGGALIPGDNAVASLNFQGVVPTGFGTGFGPTITSQAFDGAAGDRVNFVYRLSSGGDQAIGTGYIRDALTGAVVQEVFNFQVPFTGSTGVVTKDVILNSSGSYTIDFRVGSYDATGGRVVGASLDIGFAGIIRDGLSEDTAFTFKAADFLADAKDPDAGSILKISSVQATSANGASVVLNADGSVFYDPTKAFGSLNTGSTLIDTFDYTISDGDGGFDTATASIKIIGVTDMVA